jgi:hypothetical protein
MHYLHSMWELLGSAARNLRCDHVIACARVVCIAESAALAVACASAALPGVMVAVQHIGQLGHT